MANREANQIGWLALLVAVLSAAVSIFTYKMQRDEAEIRSQFVLTFSRIQGQAYEVRGKPVNPQQQIIQMTLHNGISSSWMMADGFDPMVNTESFYESILPYYPPFCENSAILWDYLSAPIGVYVKYSSDGGAREGYYIYVARFVRSRGEASPKLNSIGLYQIVDDYDEMQKHLGYASHIFVDQQAKQMGEDCPKPERQLPEAWSRVGSP